MADGADKKIHIGIETTANTAGMDAAAVGVQKLRNATGDLTEKVSVSEWGVYNLDKQLSNTGKTSETFTSGVTKMEKPLRNNAQALLMFSQGFEDAQYGIRGVLNNIPSLVMSLGGGAGLAGAISLGAVAASSLFTWLGKAKESSELLIDSFDEIKTNAQQDVSENIKTLKEELEFARDRARDLKQEWPELTKANNDFSTAALDNAGKIREAETLVAQALGLQVDKFRELRKIAAEETEKRAQTAEQQLAAEKSKVDAAKGLVTKAADDLVIEERLKSEAQTERVKIAADVDRLRLKQAELQKFADGRGNLNDLTAGPLKDFADEQVKKPGSYSGYLSRVQTEAARLAEDPQQTGPLKVAEGRLNRLEEELRKFGDENSGSVVRAALALDEAKTKQADVLAAFDLKAQELKATFDAGEFQAKAETIVQAGKAAADVLTSTVEKIETSNSNGAAAKDSILRAAEDGQITANESLAVSQSLRTLIAQTQAGLATFGGNIQELFKVQQDVDGVFRQLTAAQVDYHSRMSSGVDRLITAFGSLKAKNESLEKRITDLERP